MKARFLRGTIAFSTWAVFALAPVTLVDCLAAEAGHGDGHGAAEDHAHHPGIETLLWPVINFAAFAYLVRMIYMKQGRPALVNRKVEVEQFLNSSAAQLADAERSLAEVQRRLADIENEKAGIVSDLTEEGDRISESMIERADNAVISAKEETKKRIAGELSKAKSEIRSQVVSRSGELARRQIADKLSAEDDARLRREALQQLVIG